MKVQKETPEICRHVTQTMTAHSVQDGSVLILWCFIHTHTLQEPLILVIGWALSHDPRFKGTRCLLRSRRGVVILLLSYSLWSSNHTHLTPFMIHWSGNAYLAPLPPFSLSASPEVWLPAQSWSLLLRPEASCVSVPEGQHWQAAPA